MSRYYGDILGRRCGGKPDRLNPIREMTWTEDPPVFIGYCGGCDDCDPTGVHRKETLRRIRAKELEGVNEQLDQLRCRVRDLERRRARLMEEVT